MHIMQELTNKTNFLLENTQDFNQTTLGGPQDPIVFIDNISFYFYAISSVQDLIEELQMVMSWLFQHTSNFFLRFMVESILIFQNAPFSTWFFLTSEIAPSIFKMVSAVQTNFDEQKM